MMERIYGRVGYLGRKGEFRERKRSDRKIQERVSARHRRCSTARTRGNDVQAWRTSREVYGEDAIQVVGQTVRPGILGKVRKKLETIEGQETSKKRDDENNPRRGRKIGSSRMDRER